MWFLRHSFDKNTTSISFGSKRCSPDAGDTEVSGTDTVPALRGQT